MFIVNEHVKIMNNIGLCKRLRIYFDMEIKTGLTFSGFASYF